MKVSLPPRSLRSLVALLSAALLASCVKEAPPKVKDAKCDARLVSLANDEFQTRLNAQRAFLRGDASEAADFSHLRLNSDQVQQIRKAQADAEKAREQPPLASAKMSYSAMEHLDLGGLIFRDADLRCVSFSTSSVKGATFAGAMLDDAQLRDLTDADDTSFRGAHMSRVDFSRSRLKNAHFDAAALGGAKFVLSDVMDATFVGADMTGAGWSPTTSPPAAAIASAEGLETLIPLPFRPGEEPSLSGLRLLRSALKTGGEREAAEEVTKAYEEAETQSLWAHAGLLDLKGLSNLIAATWRSIAWGLLTDYGLSPWRAFLAYLAVAILFVPFYWGAIPRGGAESRALRWVYRKDTLAPDGTMRDADVVVGVSARGVRRGLWAALRASSNATLAVGFGDVKLGEWLARLRRKESELEAVGWLRVVAGVQSLVATVIFVLWAWCVFGDPFE
jgi:uncharacterized protein YjbI with pentapeptide repeats